MVGLFLVPGTAARATFPGVDGRIAFSDYVTGQIYTVNPDGSGLAQLTHVQVASPPSGRTGRPTATHIAFDSNRSGIRLWIMDADGRHQHMVADDLPHAADLLPVYTPDGASLVYTGASRGRVRSTPSASTEPIAGPLHRCRAAL